MAARRIVLCLFIILGTAVFGANDAQAQDRVWVQMEAHPDLATAEGRVRAYARILPAVNGYRLRTGWYAIALGPYTPGEGAAVLNQLRAQGAIPQDSYLSEVDIYQQQFFPIGANTLAPGTVTEAPTIAEAPQPAEPVLPEETVAEARQSERQLDQQGREALQIAMQWFGYYNSGIDGAFGPGTRGAMSAWQAAQGYEETGVLTTRQRAELLASYQAELDALGMQTVRDERAGIEIDLPLAMVEFARYEFPFAQFDSVGDSGVQVLLISQEGSEATLGGLYEIMQTLEIVPLEGERNRRSNSFVLTGQSDTLRSHTVARLEDGQIKGFTLIWTPERDAQMARVLDMMEDSFSTYGGTLDPGAVDPGMEQGVDLMAGLEVRQPDRARSGFYLDNTGTVLTTAEAVASCTRVLVNDRYEMTVAHSDPALGLAVLRPTQSLAPSTYAGFPTIPARIRTDVAVAGYPYEGALGAASMNFGTLADMQGLNGEDTMARLEMSIEPSEAGAPVLDATGAVIGMVLPEPDTGRALPEGVSFALRGDRMAEFLGTAGVRVNAAPVQADAMTRNALARYGSDLAVLVTCWN
ncbi:serine protease [Nioella sp.]|uniref:serine protease n=1 Tax=Nioella sp. TaxID=1912091 RepID=UPI003B52B9C3